MAEPNHQYENPLVCRICSKSCETKPKLFDHLREKHEIGRKISKCTSCSYTTDRAGNLRRHIRLVHDERSRNSHSRSRYNSRRRTRSRSPHHEEPTEVRKIIKDIPKKNTSPAISATCSPTLTTPSPRPSGKQLSMLLQTLGRRPPSPTISNFIRGTRMRMKPAAHPRLLLLPGQNLWKTQISVSKIWMHSRGHLLPFHPYLTCRIIPSKGKATSPRKLMQGKSWRRYNRRQSYGTSMEDRWYARRMTVRRTRSGFQLPGTKMSIVMWDFRSDLTPIYLPAKY